MARTFLRDMSLARLPAHGLLDLRRSTRRRLCGGNDGGWIFGHLLDGAGGSRPLAPWDDGAVRRAREGDGSWVHLDLRAPKAQDFIASCARAKGRDDEICRRTHVSSLMVADPRKTQPRCEVSSACAGMMLTLRANFGKRFEAHAVESKNVVPFRMWLGRGIIVTARGAAPDEGSLRMPALSRRLDAGAGPRSCGALASSAASCGRDDVREMWGGKTMSNRHRRAR